MLGIWVEVGTAQTTITATEMPDAKLRTRVLEQLKNLMIVDSTATTFTDDDMENSLFKSLGAPGDNIGNLTGLEYAINLTQLTLSNNSISDISAVSGLTNLRILNLARNEIRYISVLSNLIKLTSLDLSHNEIRDFSVLSTLKTKLATLYLDGSKIRTTDPLLPLTNLQNLFIRDHRITDVGELLKLARLENLQDLRLDSSRLVLSKLNDREALRKFLYVRPDSIDADRAVSFEDYPENPPIKTLSVTIRFDEPVYGFQMDDIIVETELDTGTGAATLEALTPTTEPAQTYIATIRLPTNAAGTVRVIVRAGAAETEDRRIDPAVDRVFGPIAFSTLPPPKRKIIIYECPVGWVRSDGFLGRNRRVLIYEVNVEMDLHNRVSIYKPVWVAIYVHPDEGLENLEGWKLQVALPYNHHSEYLLTAENSVVVDSKIEGVEGGFAFIKDPEEEPFPMTGIGFATSPAPGFDYRLYDDTGRKVDFGISCYKRFDIFQVLKEMEDPRVLRQVLLESFDWDQWFLRSEWTVPIPVNVPGSPSLQRVNLVGKWADLKKQ